MKTNKSPEDNIRAELLKYANDNLSSEIADILNEVAATGVYPKELTYGILAPLQKPKGPSENL